MDKASSAAKRFYWVNHLDRFIQNILAIASTYKLNFVKDIVSDSFLRVRKFRSYHPQLENILKERENLFIIAFAHRHKKDIVYH